MSATLLTTITNPTPETSDYFGDQAAALGSDQVIIGAAQDNLGAFHAGVVYLYNSNGALLSTITNPNPEISRRFGISVAALGSDRLLIGVSKFTGEEAYLFSTNGVMLTTFTNPTPPTPPTSSFFGESVAALGSDRVLFGAYGDDTGARNAGAAYLFNTNGALLTTFTNPAPAEDDYFGIPVGAMGSDRVIIGMTQRYTGAGKVYLYSTNGTLLTTFPNPTPAIGDGFGNSAAAVGSDRVIIGASGDDTSLTDSGAAYLFNTNGELLTTFTNPTPEKSEFFGHPVATQGSGRVLIGAPADNAGTTHAGAVYLFSTNGTLLTVFTNPTPAVNDNFGEVVAALSGDRLLIYGALDIAGAINAGAVYLFTLDFPYPPLAIARDDTAYSVSWITDETGLILQQTDLLDTPTVWNDVSELVSINSPTNTVQQSVPDEITNRFYRLRRP